MEIERIEDAIRTAQLAGDADFLESVLDDGFKFITPQGRLVTKQEDIDQYRSGNLKMSVVDVSEREISLFGQTAISRFKVKFEGRAGTYNFSAKFFFTRTYSKIGSDWKMVAGHSTELNEK